MRKAVTWLFSRRQLLRGSQQAWMHVLSQPLDVIAFFSSTVLFKLYLAGIRSNLPEVSV